MKNIWSLQWAVSECWETSNKYAIFKWSRSLHKWLKIKEYLIVMIYIWKISRSDCS